MGQPQLPGFGFFRRSNQDDSHVHFMKNPQLDCPGRFQPGVSRMAADRSRRAGVVGLFRDSTTIIGLAKLHLGLMGLPLCGMPLRHKRMSDSTSMPSCPAASLDCGMQIADFLRQGPWEKEIRNMVCSSISNPGRTHAAIGCRHGLTSKTAYPSGHLLRAYLFSTCPRIRRPRPTAAVVVLVRPP